MGLPWYTLILVVKLIVMQHFKRGKGNMMKVYYVRRKCVWSDTQHMSCVISLYLSCMQKVCVYWVFWNDVISLWGMFALGYVSLGSGYSTHLTSCFLAKKVGMIEKEKAVLAEESRVFVVTLRTLVLVQVSCVQIQDVGSAEAGQRWVVREAVSQHHKISSHQSELSVHQPCVL